MNRLATTSCSRRSAFAVPTVAVVLDLHDKSQRRVLDLVQRVHAGRWPLFRALSMRQMNGTLHEAVQWCRLHQPTFSVVEYRRDGYGLSWRDFPTERAAIDALQRA